METTYERGPAIPGIGPVYPRATRLIVLAVCAIVAIALALAVWTIALLEVEVVPPYVGTCGAVLTVILLPQVHEGGEALPAACYAALAPAVHAAETMFWVTISFDAIGIGAIVILLRKRGQIVRDAFAAAGREVTPWRVRLRVSRFAWIGLGVSVAAIGLLLAALQGAGDSIEYAGDRHPPLDVSLAPLLGALAAFAIAAGIGLNIAAGTRGLGSRLVGILGGLVLLSPFIYAAVESLLTPLTYS